MTRLVRFFVFLVTFFAGCSYAGVPKEFFAGDIATRAERLSKYSMPDQWGIYLYANQVIHPPATGLASVLAKRGEPMFQYILRRLDDSGNDLDYRDAMVVFQNMQWRGSYLICSNSDDLRRVESYQYKIKSPSWRGVYLEMFGRLCRDV
ncbi:hypothetical protein PQU95_18425 [Vogesella sp. DC21W]|uniref:Lipoprotein n=1 Tax=Vogesella aquatica TaxID=2984206 RepID=A0ABT5J3W8_9NEIS|nr:hypothetical protein [Vogesella aquatica]MDC7719178.1 hypothetical protein [Vogesella aquatica]